MELVCWKCKLDIMKNKYKLAGEETYIDDMTSHERKIQSQLRKIAKEKRAKGNNGKVGYEIMLNDKWVNWNSDASNTNHVTAAVTTKHIPRHTNTPPKRKTLTHNSNSKTYKHPETAIIDNGHCTSGHQNQMEMGWSRARVKDNRWTYKSTTWDPCKGKRTQGRPRRRWADLLKEDAD